MCHTAYAENEITVVVEKLDIDDDYCMTILDEGKRITNDNGNGGFFYTSDCSIKIRGTKFTEIKG